ncbi:hypothetical protein GN244_ATG03393 [Phytophthora infestans]|uniref:Uncharacterized protein n=1 Tax=Phytophthora infestans TaxID=4787 RepID=A0A833T973_PHYIN|nr:hypothetical protein GN244_ATG03393 [Phytophthora infestans]KAF4127719.1 hypothetical protein GN958_ATG23085 [Phytophthora infestans]
MVSSDSDKEATSKLPTSTKKSTKKPTATLNHAVHATEEGVVNMTTLNMEEQVESVEEMGPKQLVTTTKPLVTTTKPLVTPTKLSVTPKDRLAIWKRGCQQDDQDGDESLSSDEG